MDEPGKLYQVWTYDLWGNDEDGYEVNDRYKNEKVFIPNRVLDGSDLDLCKYLAEQDVIVLADSVKPEDIEITGESEYTLYFSYQGKPDFELERIEE